MASNFPLRAESSRGGETEQMTLKKLTGPALLAQINKLNGWNKVYVMHMCACCCLYAVYIDSLLCLPAAVLLSVLVIG